MRVGARGGELAGAEPTRAALQRAALAGLVLLPLVFSAPTLGDRFATAEDALNASMWGLGARNLVDKGFAEALRGAVVTPHPGTLGNGVYAHHPPLPVWAMVVPVWLGGWEGGARLIALLCAAAYLALLARVLGRFFSPGAVLAAVGAVATSGYLLQFGRLLTTVTLAAPLFLALLDAVLVWRETGRVPRWAPAAAALLLLSSWDGFLGAAAIAVGALASLRGNARPWRPLIAPFAAALAAACFVAWHLVDATGGLSELLWQASWRAKAETDLSTWTWTQLTTLWRMLGPVTLAGLVLAPLAFARRTPGALRWAMAVGAVPGVAMLLVFRQGAQNHAFWGYLLTVPAAFALALAFSEILAGWRRLFLAALAVQALGLAAWSWTRLEADHREAAAARFVARHFLGSERVLIFAWGRFHPWVAWNALARPEHSRSLEELEKKGAIGEVPVLADARHAQKAGCQPLPQTPRSQDGRWVVLPASTLRALCTPLSPHSPPLGLPSGPPIGL